jgi:hypothetical protein
MGRRDCRTSGQAEALRTRSHLAKIDTMPRLPLLLIAVLLSATLSNCVATKTIPDAQSLASAYQVQLRAMASDFKELDEQKASGSLSEEAYSTQRKQLENQAHHRAVAAMWDRHQLVEIQHKSDGIPTPDAPVMIAAPRAGAMGTSGSTYVPFNQRSSGILGANGSSMDQLGQSIQQAQQPRSGF